MRLVRRIDNPCGAFSVRRRQIPIKRPRIGNWTLQVDQQRRYSRAPDSVYVRVKIEVQLDIRRWLTGSATREGQLAVLATSTRTWSPLENWPCSSPRASGSTRWRWITRLSGRAPYTGS